MPAERSKELANIVLKFVQWVQTRALLLFIPNYRLTDCLRLITSLSLIGSPFVPKLSTLLGRRTCFLVLR